jgi:glyoxylase-like metal-dependent hydrolase (beta-lactamase superfamily II)
MTTKPQYTQITDWYEIDEVAPRVFRVRERYYREDYRCNIYVIKGMVRDIVVDAGLGLASLTDFVRTVSRAPQLILTHAHYDHIGSAHEFSEVAIHAAEETLIAHPTRENTYANLLLATKDFQKLPWDNYDAGTWEPIPAPATMVVHEGALIDLGDRSFEVLHTPGHSQGSICLWDARNRLLISGDTVYSGELFDQLPCSNVSAYLQSMERLRALPVAIALPGHGHVLDYRQFQLICSQYILSRRTTS